MATQWRAVRTAMFAIVTGTLVATGAIVVPEQARADVPITDNPPTYTSYPPISDPGKTASNYFQPYWYDTSGRHIQAHGGAVVTATSDELGVNAGDISQASENGEAVYFWYGQDNSNGYTNSPGVAVYKSYDSMNWTYEGDALRTVTSAAQLTDPYFASLYGTVGADGTVDQSEVSKLDYYLDMNPTQPDGTAKTSAIVERPKVLYNATTKTWVMWWHSDGSTSPGESNYARSLAGVATSSSPTGPFKLVGAYRLYNETSYKTACNQSSAVPGGSRDMTVYQDSDGTAYLAYSSEENRSLYLAKLDPSYTNVEKTTTTDPTGIQYSADGRYPDILADGSSGAPVAGEDFSIVKRCGLLEAPALFKHDGRYYLIASGATGWSPNQQTYYTADNLLGTWIRGVVADDPYENASFSSIPEGGDGLLSYGDARGTTFGSQSASVFALDAARGEFVYVGDRWDSGAADSTYVWLPLTFGENGVLEMRNPAAEDPSRWSGGWSEAYWDSHGAGPSIWRVTGTGLPAGVRTNQDLSTVLPKTVAVSAGGTVDQVPVTWDKTVFTSPGTQTITGTLAADANFSAGRTFTRTITVQPYGLYNIAPEATVDASSRANLDGTTIDGSLGKGWDDWASGGKYPLKSWLSYTWSSPRSVKSVKVDTYKDGATATWPSHVSVDYQDDSGAWRTSDVATEVSQDASGAAPVVTLDTSSLPPTTALRVDLSTATQTWQSIAEVEIYGYGSSAATALSDLAVDGATIAGFDPGTWKYSFAAKYPTQHVVSATASDGADATVAVTQPTADNPYADATVTARQNGDVTAVQTYRVDFVAASTDASLSAITVNGKPLTGFESAVTSYDNVSIPAGTSPDITATATDSHASAAVAYDATALRATITVTAQDPDVVQTYQVQFTNDPRSTDADLAGISVNGTSINGFSAADTAYTVDVGSWGVTPVVTATAHDPHAIVQVRSELDGAAITVTAVDPNVTKTYTLAFTASTCAAPSVSAPWRSAAGGSASSVGFCQGEEASFRITDSNDGVWTSKDHLTDVYQAGKLNVADSVGTYVAGVNPGANSDPRTGLVVRNDLSSAGTGKAKGYALLVASPSGVYLQFDSNGNGYIDSQTAAVPAGTWPVYLKLEYTSATTVTGYYRSAANGSWQVVGTAALSGAEPTLDAGVFAAANNAKGAAVATLLDTWFSSDVTAVTPIDVTTTAGSAPILPATVSVNLADSSRASRTVRWTQPDPASYRQTGTFTVDGNVDGTDLPAKATVSVKPRPAFSNEPQATFAVGAGGSFDVSVTGVDPATISQSGAPAWLALIDHGDGSATLSGTPGAGSVGEYPFVLTASDDSGPVTVQSFVLTVVKGSQTIAFGAIADHTLGEPDFTVNASADSGLPVVFSASGACAVTGDAVHLTQAGTCTVTAGQAGSADYNAAIPVARTFTVARGSAVVSAPAVTTAWGTPATVLVGVTSSAASVSGQVRLDEGATDRGTATLSNGQATFTLPIGLAAGIHTITATYLGNSNLAQAGSTFAVNVMLPGAWNGSTAYQDGATVSYQGQVYTTDWYTKDELPGSKVYGAWQHMAMTEDGTAIWTASRIFQAGDVASYNGHTYTARWYSRNQTPGAANGPWVLGG
ncbi:MAG TPA: Ig-like domain-containing protein [Humibacter sp.]|nr:Ig-like domain-containing protein [Humibacter sp.]